MDTRAVYEEIWDELFSDRTKEFVTKMKSAGVQFEEYDQALDKLKASSRHEKQTRFYMISEHSPSSFVRQYTGRIFQTQVAPLFEEKEALLLKQHKERFERVAFFTRESKKRLDEELSKFRNQIGLVNLSESEIADREMIIRAATNPVFEKYKEEVFYFTQTLGHVDGLIEKMVNEALYPQIEEQKRV